MSNFQPLPQQEQWTTHVGAVADPGPGNPPKRSMISSDGITIGWGAFVITGAIIGSAFFIHGLLTKGKDGT